MKLFLIYTSTIILLNTSLWGQNHEINSESIGLEHPHYTLINNRSSGFMLLELIPELNGNKTVLNIKQYDTHFDLKWENFIPVDMEASFVFKKHVEHNVYLVFLNKKSGRLDLIELDIEEGYFRSSGFQLTKGLIINDLVANENHVWISGTIEDHGVIYQLDMSTNSFTLLPTGHSAPVYDVPNIHYNSKKRSLNYVLTTIDKNHQTFLHRSVLLNGKVVENVLIEPAVAVQLGRLYVVHQDDQTICAGLFYKQYVNKPKGIFCYIIENGEIKWNTFIWFKSVENYGHYVNYSEIANAENSGPPLFKHRKISEEMIFDNVIVTDKTVTLVIESIKKDFKSKGILQQQMEKQIIVDHVDQNIYRRHQMNPLNAGQTVEDRIDGYSGTAIQQYMYRDAIVSQPVFQGYAYDRTLIFGFNRNLSKLEHTSIRFPLSSMHNLEIENSYYTDQIMKFKYPGTDHFHEIGYNEISAKFREPINIKATLNEFRFFNWYDDKILGYKIVADDQQYHLQVIKF